MRDAWVRTMRRKFVTNLRSEWVWLSSPVVLCICPPSPKEPRRQGGLNLNRLDLDTDEIDSEIYQLKAPAHATYAEVVQVGEYSQ